MPFFDTHTHLDYLQQFSGERLVQLMQNAQAAGVQKILIVAVLQRDFKTIEKMTALYPGQLYYGLGLHPLYIQEHQIDDLGLLDQALASRPANCTAVAEIGLERALPELLTEALWRKQCDFLEAQLHLAKKHNLPVNLHSRKSHEQLFSFLRRIAVPKCGVVHGFAGSYDQAKRFVDLGYKVGVGGTITYERANKTRQTIAKLPLEALLLETDSPDMPVFGFQGQPNRPERVVQVFNALCALRSETPAQIAETIWRNSVAKFA
ncbi:deoxyribonuclease [Aggregatibacter actinomycetemcomitans]|uniref:Deoxyribonuclease n=3 Tax=Aggregatibacter actinomycetemcomitans TaxID=714 RepID=A0A5D0EIW1_AGGAC|nr:TatD family hydrolase [Aggregatibacter actinomycetemcomitans]AFI86559.1 deoxyribonuclease [Aggregatibacter actinomycetemcomitans D7S-1]KYK96003.1 deoxyribonuclease [Aggregatibacter actinomycetemcomitans serotype d str. SA3733]AMQ94578.1 deoxyribonuclease [Aggregatibacter actinomycetemcomitans]ANU82866.1 deoxyribonuclease [Aggregatibacter actinomycetemcomitans]EKX98384.1 hydrolase, TatD family [Aggregatibacter actinomycetemcomitans Y4]